MTPARVASGQRHMGGGTGSIIDLTFASNQIAGSLTWKVSNLYTASDHLAILYNISLGSPRTGVVTKQHYIDSTLDMQTFREAMQSVNMHQGGGEDMAGQLMDAVKSACDSSMSRSGVFTGHRPVYWWNEVIAKARQQCVRSRRSYHRARGSANFEELRLVYNEKRKLLKKAIKESKRRCFLELCDEAEHDLWGRAYKVVMKKMNGLFFLQARTDRPRKAHSHVEFLFPPQQSSQARSVATQDHERPTEIAAVTVQEVLNLAKSIAIKKAAGPDGIPNKAKNGGGAYAGKKLRWRI
ncbi:hypothetical protein ACLKA6_012281 [Drosophila palustris]